MARTPEGRRLTEEHRKAQIRLGGMAAALTVQNGANLDPEDLDGTRDQWEARQLAILGTLRAQSQRLAEEYLKAFREAEGMDPAPIKRPPLRPVREVTQWVVPTIKARMRDGRP